MRESQLESKFQGELIVELKELFPGCEVLVKPGYYVQGFPDLIILYKDQWAALECKASISSDYQPNQEWWIEKLAGMSYASMVCPENRKEIIDALYETFSPGRPPRLLECE